MMLLMEVQTWKSSWNQAIVGLEWTFGSTQPKIGALMGFLFWSSNDKGIGMVCTVRCATKSAFSTIGVFFGSQLELRILEIVGNPLVVEFNLFLGRPLCWGKLWWMWTDSGLGWASLQTIVISRLRGYILGLVPEDFGENPQIWGCIITFPVNEQNWR